MRAKELMSAPAVSIGADATLKEIVNLIIANQISSVPVIDRPGRVIGIISWYELFPRAKKVWTPDVRIPVLFKQSIDIKHIANTYKQAAHLVAKDIMCASPACAKLDDDIEHIVWMMAEENLHMIPVLDAGSLVGVITRSDIMRFLAQEL